jgi:hypothetical protein
VVCTVTGRVICGVIVVNGRRLFEPVTISVDRHFRGREEEQLFFVMVLGPLVMNMLQAYVQVGGRGPAGRGDGASGCGGCGGVGLGVTKAG